MPRFVLQSNSPRPMLLMGLTFLAGHPVLVTDDRRARQLRKLIRDRAKFGLIELEDKPAAPPPAEEAPVLPEPSPPATMPLEASEEVSEDVEEEEVPPPPAAPVAAVVPPPMVLPPLAGPPPPVVTAAYLESIDRAALLSLAARHNVEIHHRNSDATIRGKILASLG